VYGLKGQDVTLHLDGAAAGGPVMTEATVARADKSQRLDLSPPYDAPWSDIAFVADLDGILGGPHATIHPDFLDPHLPADAKVACRVVLAGGRLTGGVPRDAFGRHIAWGFNDPIPGNTYRQAITDVVEFHAGPAHAIQLVLTKRGEGTTRRITLKAGNIRAKVTNIAQSPSHCDGAADHNCPPHHFYAYYELLKEDPPHRPTPGPMFLAGSAAQIKNTDPPVYCPPPLAFYE
jgi:hypothetical protein